MSCNVSVPKTGFYVYQSDLEDFQVGSNVITRKKYLSHLPVSSCKEDESAAPPTDEWYPLVNSYYQHTEDVDAFARVNHLLANRPSFTSLFETEDLSDVYPLESNTEKSVHIRYLQSNPVSFIILGKPGLGEQELGRMLADYWQCVYIDPETLIEEEIQSGSRAGQCIEFNLRCGRAVGVDVILRLVEKRISSQTARHRGFVICGLPVIPNDLYEEDPVSSESAVFNVREIFEEIYDTTIRIGVPPSKPHVSISSKVKSDDLGEEEQEAEPEFVVETEFVDPKEPNVPADLPLEPPVQLDLGSVEYDICGQPEIGTNYDDQLNFIFNLMKDPYLIIYIACGTADVISKRDDTRFDIYSKQVIDLQRESANKVLYNFFTNEPGVPTEEIPEDFFEASHFDIDTSRLRHLVRLPRNFPINVSAQLDRYHYTAVNLVERRVLMHDPQYFVKVDGRTTPSRMFHIIKAKLRVLPLQKVVLPAKLYVSKDQQPGEGEETATNIEGLSPTDCFRDFSKRELPSPLFKWTWSEWGAKCPVSMTEGIYIDGDPKFAVHFMNKIFFLANEDCFYRFCRNPRHFLLPPYPKPSCRIFIFGPKFSGKTAVAECLSYYLNGTVLCPETMTNQFISQQQDQFKEKIRQTAIVKAMGTLNEIRRQEVVVKEKERAANIEQWQAEVRNCLTKLEMEFEDKHDDVQTLELSSFPMQLKKSKARIDQLSDTVLPKLALMARLEELNVPDVKDVESVRSLLNDSSKLLSQLPEDLKRPNVYRPANVYDDFVIDYADRAVNETKLEDLEVSSTTVLDIFLENMKDVEKKSLEQGSKRGSWIIDGMLTDMDLIEKLYPEYIADEVIVLRDEDNFSFLLERFKVRGSSTFKDFRNFFLSIGKVDAAWRSPSVVSTDSYKTGLVHNVLEDIFGEVSSSIGQENKKYLDSLRKFEEEWELVNEYFSKNNINPIEINIANKSVPDVLKEVLRLIDDKYRYTASIITEEELAEEVQDFGKQFLRDDEGEGGEVDVPVSDENTFEKNRRYGDTYFYCPVTFHEKWVLWKGKGQYAVRFESNVYLLSSEEDMNKFVVRPRDYLPQTKSPDKFPPPRICIIGIGGSGKTSLSQIIANNLGVSCLSYKDIILKKLDILDHQNFYSIITDNRMKDTAIYKYLVEDVALPEDMLYDVLGTAWFQEPLKYVGFVFDDFPKRPSDIQFMTKNKSIPDLIILLTVDENATSAKLLESALQVWQKKLKAHKEMFEKNEDKIMSDWHTARKVRYDTLLEEKREKRYSQKRKQGMATDAEEPTDSQAEETGDEMVPIRSQVSFHSVEEQEDIDEVNRILENELPEPHLQEITDESIEETTEKLESAIRESFQMETEYIKSIKDMCESELIPFMEIDANDFNKCKIGAMIATNKVKFRSTSLFERCFDISVEVAERLLSYGYCFLSRYGRTCPVQYFEKKNPIQMFIPMEQKYKIFPVIHRQFIYFIVGQENALKFKEDPLKFINTDDVNFPLIPFRIAIIGPPKCGKTSLAERFKLHFGFKLISRGQASRYVLAYLPNSSLAENMENVLGRGWELTDEMVARSTEAAAFDSRAVTQGIVFDGFPTTITEVRHLSYLGLVPHLVIDLQANKQEIFECLSSDFGRRNLPRYSERFVKHLVKEWLKDSESFRFWFDREYQTLAKLHINTTKWAIWHKSYELTTAVCSEIQHYHRHAHDDWPLRLANMQVTPLEFLERQSGYQTFCPCCLHFTGKFLSGGDPPDRTGLVHFRKYFYWICDEHIELFLRTPEAYLPPYNNHTVPEYLPKRLTLSEMPDNLFEDGICVVCYCKNTEMSNVKGVLEFAVEYKNKVYLFDSKYCIQTFLQSPNSYTFKINFKSTSVYPSLRYSELPILGMLEQYVAKYLVKAVNTTATHRPVVPGLSISASAAISVGINLKMLNPKGSDEVRPLYERGFQLFNKRRQNLLKYLENMKSVLNPYLYYEEILPPFRLTAAAPVPSKNSQESLTTAMHKLVKEMVDKATGELDF